MFGKDKRKTKRVKKRRFDSHHFPDDDWITTFVGMKPTIAIVILNWNGEKLLSRFLPSVISNSQQEGTRIIVADNGSTDSSLSLLHNRFPEIEILDLHTNYGFAKGYNEALRQVKADYYILLNSDVEVTPGWIEPLIRLMKDDASIAAVQPKIRSWQKKDEFEY
ncbi:MAG: glycosyltransferase, partial [Candidatus Pacebacteria bacterium]|nr:glycosyltransferase [Candidatus Paceibacterota bacterium]